MRSILLALTIPALAALAACGTARDARLESDVDYIAIDRDGRPRQAARVTTKPNVTTGDRPSDRAFYDRHTPALAGPWSGVVTERCRAIEPMMRVAAAEHGVDVGLIAGIVRTESTFDVTARSRRGATGLMQVMPSVGRRLRCGDLRDPERNLACGLTILKRFLARYDDQLIYGLSAYHAGYRVPNDAIENGTVPSNMRYIEKVLGYRATYLRHGCGQ
jgi:hypothetical protein